MTSPDAQAMLKAERDFINRLKANPANVAAQLVALTHITDWALVQHRDNLDNYLTAAAELLTIPAQPSSVATDEITRLQAREATLIRERDAMLANISRWCDESFSCGSTEALNHISRIVREALATSGLDD